MQTNKLQFEKTKIRYVTTAYIIIHLIVGFSLPTIGLTYQTPIFLPVFFCLGMIATCSWVIRKYNIVEIDVRKIFGKIPERTQWVKLFGLTILTGLFSFSSILVIVGILSLLIPHSTQSTQPFILSNTDSLLQRLLIFLTLVVIAPITEEFLFRGVILNRWIYKWGLTKAIIFSSILFGCLHAHPIGLTMFALVMAVLYIKTQTLWIPIACHSINNLIAFSLLSIPKLDNPDIKYSPDQGGVIGGIILSTIIMIVSSAFLWRFLNENIPKGYVQPSYLIQPSEYPNNSNYVKAANSFMTLILFGAILSAVTQLFSYGIHVYRSNFSNDAYRYMSKSAKPFADIYMDSLELAVAEKNINNCISNLKSLADLYERESEFVRSHQKESTSVSNSDMSILFSQKAHKIRDLITKLSNRSLAIDENIIKAIN